MSDTGPTRGPGTVYVDPETGELVTRGVPGVTPDTRQPIVGKPAAKKQPKGKRTLATQPKDLASARSLYEALNVELARVNGLLTRAGLGGAPGGIIRDGNVSYTFSSLQAQSSELQTQVDLALDAVKKFEAPVKSAQSEIKKIDDRLNVSADEAKAGAKPVSEAERKKLLKRKSELQKKINTAEAVAPEAPTVAAPAAGTTAAKPGTSAAAARRMQEGAVVPGQPGTPATTPTGGTGGTGAGGAAATDKKRGRKKKQVEQAPDWSTIVQEEFGSLWDVYTSNPDVKAVLDKSVQEGWFNDETQLTAALRNTSWFKTTERAARQFSIRQSTDPAQLDDEINAGVEELRQTSLANGFTFDDPTLRRLATDRIKYGWSTQQTTNAIGSEAVAYAKAGGGAGMADLRSGYVGQSLRKVAQSYAQKPSEAILDAWVQDIMTGKKTDVQWNDLMRESAKTQFRSLQPALDKGQDVETALYAYKQQANSILGDVTDVTEIDWTSDKWNKALNYRDEKTGEYRQMDLWEWNKYLRTLPEWQQTGEAKSIYSNIGYTLAKGFGKIA
jgi:hypothetical protein